MLLNPSNLPARASRMAAIVFLFGTSRANGSAFSAAIRFTSSRNASDRAHSSQHGGRFLLRARVDAGAHLRIPCHGSITEIPETASKSPRLKV